MNAKPKAETGIINIRGRDYQTVALRIKNFREDHPAWCVACELVVRDLDVVVMRCIIADETGKTIATGFAEEFRASSNINKTSAVENCETSAIGRALAAAGYGGTEFASANEVQHAIESKPEAPGVADWRAKLERCETLDDLQVAWKSMPQSVRAALSAEKDAAKARLAA